MHPSVSFHYIFSHFNLKTSCPLQCTKPREKTNLLPSCRRAEGPTWPVAPLWAAAAGCWTLSAKSCSPAGTWNSAEHRRRLRHCHLARRIQTETAGAASAAWGIQCWCVPDRCVPDLKFLDVAPLGQSVPWILSDPGPRHAKFTPCGSQLSTHGPHQECPAFGLYSTNPT